MDEWLYDMWVGSMDGVSVQLLISICHGDWDTDLIFFIFLLCFLHDIALAAPSSILVCAS